MRRVYLDLFGDRSELQLENKAVSVGRADRVPFKVCTRGLK